MTGQIKVKKSTIAGVIGLIIIMGIIASYLFFFSSSGITGNVIASGKTGTSVGDYAPSLTFETINSQTLTVNDLKGKRVILQGFASWYPSCKVQAREINKALPSLDNVQVVNLDVWEGETAADVREKFISDVFGSEDRVPNNWVLTAYEPDFVTTYRLYAMDETYILNEKGIIIFKDPQVTKTETFLKVLGGT